MIIFIWAMAAVGAYFSVGFVAWFVRAVFISRDSWDIILSTIIIFLWPICLFEWLKPKRRGR